MAQSNPKSRPPCFKHQWERKYDHHYRNYEHDQDYMKHQQQKRKHEENAILQKKQEIEKQLQQEHEKELELNKEQYLGGMKSNKKFEKPSKKFRFSFDWEDTEDTSRNINLIHPKYEVPLLFGRGFRGGIDRNEQKILALKGTKVNYEKYEKCTYLHWSKKKIEEMTERDWRIFQEDCNISYKGSHIPRPMRNWNEVALDSKLLKVIDKLGYSKPSSIQMAAIPIGLHQRDIIGIAETGCGKTLAYVLPMLHFVSKIGLITKEMEAEGPLAVVLAPTRELTQQIERETMKFVDLFNIRIVSIVGGQSIQEQAFKLGQGCEVVIATPGRLIDCLERRYVVLNQCHYIVLDEADRMMDMGFEPQVKTILDAMPSNIMEPQNQYCNFDTTKMYRTTCMFSATMSSTVEQLARKYLHNSITITIGTKGKVTEHITQHIKIVKEGEKLDSLYHVLKENEMSNGTTIVFVNAKHTANTLWKTLDKYGYQVTTLHGGKMQEQREESLDGFRTKKFKYLVATDVVARGIDIANVSHVINYDMPKEIEMYIHRIGRTARAGKRGTATIFLTLQDYNIFSKLKQVLIQSNSPIPLELAHYKSSNDHQIHFH